MHKILYIDAFSGISGDMALGALVSLGFDVAVLHEELKRIGIRSRPMVHAVRRNGIEAMKFSVEIDEGERVERDYAEIKRLLTAGMSPGPPKDMALKIFALLAEAEGKAHGVNPQHVHFHEVGAIDSIVDIVGVSLGVCSIEPARVVSSPIPIGRGFVETRHGRLPIPAPATVILLEGIPVYDTHLDGELVTPTGAAILRALGNDFTGFPDMVLERSGYGAGDREFESHPNLLRLILGRGKTTYETDDVVVLTTNIDDMNPQFFEYVTEKLFMEGALDVAMIPLVMKKGRPAVSLVVLAEPSAKQRMIDLILAETTSSGLRVGIERRYKLSRWVEKKDTEFGQVRVKYIADADGTIKGAFPEYDDVKNAAKKSGIPIFEVYRRLTKSLEKDKKL